jgi:hypothetical protein
MVELLSQGAPLARRPWAAELNAFSVRILDAVCFAEIQRWIR